MKNHIRTGMAMLVLLFANQTSAMDPADYGEFQQLLQAPLPALIDKAEKVLAASAPPPQPAAAPPFDFGNRTINIAYRIATDKPDLIARFACYAPACEQLHLASLADCFFTNGRPGDYSLLAAGIETCLHETVLIFLWHKQGATPGEITGALRFLFDASVHEAPAITP